MNQVQKKKRAIAVPYELSKSRFSWIELLVIAAALITLAVVIDASVGRAKAAAPVAAPVAAAGVPCAEVPMLAALSPNSGGPLAESIQSASLLAGPEVPSPNVVPEPGTLGLLGLGLLGLGLSRRKVAKITR